MIRHLVLCALLAFASCDWTGSWNVTDAVVVNDYDNCDLPPLQSTVTITANPVTGMTFTRVSTYEGSITAALGWSPSQNIGSSCERWSWCYSGNLTTPYTAVLYWYPDDSFSNGGCQISISKGTPPPPPPPPVVVSWVGSWTVSSSQPATACSVPSPNTQVTITTNPSGGLTMTGTDSQTKSSTSWALNWGASQLQAGPVCANYLCTSGTLSSQGNTLTASLNWVEDNLYICNAVLTSSSSSEVEDVFLGF